MLQRYPDLQHQGTAKATEAVPQQAADPRDTTAVLHRPTEAVRRQVTTGVRHRAAAHRSAEAAAAAVVADTAAAAARADTEDNTYKVYI